MNSGSIALSSTMLARPATWNSWAMSSRRAWFTRHSWRLCPAATPGFWRPLDSIGSPHNPGGLPGHLFGMADIMVPRYHHRQLAKTILSFLFAAVVILAVPLLKGGAVALYVLLTVLLAMTGVLFHSLTIRIEGGFLHWHFGPGFWKKSVALKDIDRVDVVRNRWYYGWGIRYTRHGWLYNVSGLRAVQIGLKTGKKMRLGTDEPEKLMLAVNSAGLAAAGPA